VRKFIRTAALCAVTLAAITVVPTMAGAKGGPTTCNGSLEPGTYNGVVVPDGGVCIIDSGPLTINSGLTVGARATFVFGSEETPDVTSTINGGVHASGAASVQIHFSKISGGIEVHGGGLGGFGGPFGVTWNTIEDSVINGGVTIDGYRGFWMGFIRNSVNGPVNLNDNVLQDHDGNEYVTNTIRGGLSCADNEPAPQVGDSEGELNQVIGPVTGQCTDVV
jgi:hypothetical protein